MKFVKFYDENVKLINNLSNNKIKKYANLEICPGYQAQCIQNFSLKKYKNVTEYNKMKLGEFADIQYKLLKQLINVELDNYAAANKLSKDSIKVTHKSLEISKGYVSSLKDIKFEPIIKKSLFNSGSLIGANFSFDVNYEPADYYIDQQYIVKKSYKRVLIPIPNQIISIQNGNHLKYKDKNTIKYGDKMQRFNYILRIYKRNDKLQELMDAIAVYNRKLNKLENDYNNKVMNFVEIGEKFEQAMNTYKVKVNDLKEKYLQKKMKTIEKQKYITSKITQYARQTTQRLVNKIKERGYKLRDAANNATLHTQLNYLFDLAAKNKESQITLRDLQKRNDGIYFKYDVRNAGTKEYLLLIKDINVTPYHCPIHESPNRQVVGNIIQRLIEQVKNKTNAINREKGGKKIAFKFENGTVETRQDSSDYYESDYSDD